MSQMISIPLARQTIDQSDIDAVCCALKQPQITRGDEVALFERDLAKICQIDFAVAFSSGSAALNAACLALGIGRGDHLFVPANTFVATASCGFLLGADLHFVDVDPSTGLMSVKHLAELLKEQPLGRSFLFPVHFAGRTVDLIPLKKAMAGREFTIIEDSSHAIGSLDNQGHPIGSCCHSTCSTFSFHPSKNMTTGEGGAVTTKCKEFAKRLRALRNSGIERTALDSQEIHPWHYFVQQMSSNFHLTNFAAALGRSQLKKLKHFQAKRERAVLRYNEQLKGIDHLEIPPFESPHRAHFHLFFVLIDFAALKKTREELMLFLQKKSIGTGVHYIPLYHHPCWRQANRALGSCRSVLLSGCERYYQKTLSLPLFVEMSDRQIDTVCLQLKQWLLKGDR